VRDLRVTLVETELHWEDPEANRAAFSRRLRPLAGRADLFVLPEMFTTGFTMRGADFAESMDGATVAWMRETASELSGALYGSVIVQEGGRVFNRGLFVTPGGEITAYDKRHLFRMGREDRFYAPGGHRVVAEWRGWRFLLQVCYDLRFPVFSRNRGDYDALLYVANWPEPRRDAWKRLLAARAIENLSYSVGVNRVGADGAGISYSGDSGAWDFRGDPMAGVREDGKVGDDRDDGRSQARSDAGPDALLERGREGLVTVTLDGTALTAFRERFPAHLDADEFELRLGDRREEGPAGGGGGMARDIHGEE